MLSCCLKKLSKLYQLSYAIEEENIHFQTDRKPKNRKLMLLEMLVSHENDTGIMAWVILAQVAK